MREIYSLKRHVLKEEIDELNHVNNIVYFNWIQDIAYKHWNVLTENNPQTDYVWYTIRHEIDYLKQAVLGDEITVKTWVGETKGVKSVRHVEIFKEEILLAKSQTTYCLLNTKTKRPTRITESVLKILLPNQFSKE